MKIRIKGNSIRFRLTKSEVHQLCTGGSIQEKTEFLNEDFMYSVKLSKYHDTIAATYETNKIQLYLPENMGANWNETNQVGFEHTQEFSNGKILSLLLEKDFACLDNRQEDQADNYPNPKAVKN